MLHCASSFAQARHFAGPCDGTHEVPNKDYADELYWLCQDPQIRPFYDKILEQEQALVSPPVIGLWRQVADKVPRQPSFNTLECQVAGENPDLQRQRTCIVSLLEKRRIWLDKALVAVRAHPDFVKTAQAQQDCKISKDELMLLLCEDYPSSFMSYARIIALNARLHAPDATPGMRDYIPQSNAWKARLFAQCKGANGCKFINFGPWEEELNQLVKSEGNRQAREQALQSADYLSCQFNANGRASRYVVTLFTSGRVEMLEPAANASGIPLERIFFVYYGRQQHDGTRTTIEFYNVLAGANDNEATSLIMGIGGGVPLNDGRLQASIADHRMIFDSADMASGKYIYVRTGRTNLQTPIACKHIARPS